MTDIVDRHVVMLAPKKRNIGILFTVSDHVQGGCLSLTLRDDPMLDAEVLTGIRVRPTCNIAGCKDSWCTRLGVGIYGDASFDEKPRFYREVDSGAHSDA